VSANLNLVASIKSTRSRQSWNRPALALLQKDLLYKCATQRKIKRYLFAGPKKCIHCILSAVIATTLKRYSFFRKMGLALRDNFALRIFLKW